MTGVKAAHRPLVAKLDALMGETVPHVKRAIKWSTPARLDASEFGQTAAAELGR